MRESDTCLLKKVGLWVVILLLFPPCFFSCKQDPDAVQPFPEVPLPDKERYNELGAELTRLQTYFTQRQPVSAQPETLWGVNLQTASGFRGEALLRTGYLNEMIFQLAQLKAIGAELIHLDLPFPILNPGFPSAQAYTFFYRRLAEEVKKQGLKLAVSVRVISNRPERSTLRVNYSGLSMTQLQTGLRLTVTTILLELQPDFLTVLSEPSLLAAATGLEIGPARYASLVEGAISGLPRFGKIGAGCATWEPIQFTDELMKTSIDFFDVQIGAVPLQKGLQPLAEILRLCKQNGKLVVAGDSWLTKAQASDFTGSFDQEAYRRDNVFSHWQALDAQFIEMLAALASYQSTSFVSVRHMEMLYAYLPYEEQTAQQPESRLFAELGAVLSDRLTTNALSPAGEQFRQASR